MKIACFTTILLFSIILTGCTNKELVQRLVRGLETRTSYSTEDVKAKLDEQFGENTYTIAKHTAKYKDVEWVVTLNDYPDIPFKCWDEGAGRLLGRNRHELRNDADLVFQQASDWAYMGEHRFEPAWYGFLLRGAISDLDSDLPQIYDEVTSFANFIKIRYPIMIEQRWCGIKIFLTGDPVNDYIPIDVAWVNDQKQFEVLSYQELYDIVNDTVIQKKR